MQVLNVAIFSESRYDLPIFCADFFSTSKANICVLDLNPLYTTEQNKDYKEKYFTSILPMAKNYIKLLPWGGKLTAESLQFFSPIVLWTKPHRSADVQEILFSAFQDYLLAWLSLLEVAVEAPDKVVLAQNQEAQHRYLMWRATKDPGRPVLTKLIGDVACEKYIKEFLFSGLESLGTKKFLDYFPEYKGDDGSLSTVRSVAGRSYAKRPWGEDGKFIQSLEI
ncbi:hypothetical protein O6H91_05G038300 [Diphasiastrum complanatum]|nr:hypothetical protein O6H91_05G038300 [Diphasiastrum complanatum]